MPKATRPDHILSKERETERQTDRQRKTLCTTCSLIKQIVISIINTVSHKYQGSRKHRVEWQTRAFKRPVWASPRLVFFHFKYLHAGRQKIDCLTTTCPRSIERYLDKFEPNMIIW